MSLAQAFPITNNPKSEFVSELIGLAEIDRATINMVTWQREQSESLIGATKKLSDRSPHLNVREEVTPDSVSKALTRHLGKTDNLEPLINDISELTDAFCCLMGCDSVGLRLEVVDRASCPRFHVDQVVCRLITTYQGPATQWLAHQDADRSKLGRGNGGLPDEQSGLMTSTDQIQSIASGDVALLKGEGWPGNQGAGIIHRSPTIPAGEQRLVLTLDPIF
ncbi:DUF1826 domain-containing protein [Rhodanobacter aciditrophus]|uniref:DUF1826 domain-containing protein n=1 Tax=Rhodanobacter aciditrophus TaxID=1623218 RepID=A0ABW4B3U3_9GAMM